MESKYKHKQISLGHIVSKVKKEAGSNMFSGWQSHHLTDNKVIKKQDNAKRL